MRWLKWIVGGLVALVAVVAAVLYVSARQSLDQEFRHTRATEQLPLLGDTSSDGLVRIETDRGTFRARVAGLSGSGPPVVFLHGFPESSAMWEPLLAAASSAGFRAVAFDQRGYSPGVRPLEVEAYALDELVEDVRAVARAAGFERFHLVGHDWGSMVGWNLASAEPDRVLSWASLSIPHPSAAAGANADRDGPPGYVRFFQTTTVAETAFLSGDMALMRNVLYTEMPPEQLEEYMALFAEPGALTAAFNWYRALPSGFASSSLMAGEVSQPVFYVWGENDMELFVHPRVREQQVRFIKGPYEELSLDAGHWLMQEEPEAVTAAVMEHLQAQPR